MKLLAIGLLFLSMIRCQTDVGEEKKKEKKKKKQDQEEVDIPNLNLDPLLKEMVENGPLKDYATRLKDVDPDTLLPSVLAKKYNFTRAATTHWLLEEKDKVKNQDPSDSEFWTELQKKIREKTDS